VLYNRTILFVDNILPAYCRQFCRQNAATKKRKNLKMLFLGTEKTLITSPLPYILDFSRFVRVVGNVLKKTTPALPSDVLYKKSG
jgi:hypothetical protein